MTMHKLMAETMDTVIEEIKAIQKNARENNNAERPVWPMIVLRTPKGWTGPKVVDGKQIEGLLPRPPGAPDHGVPRASGPAQGVAGELPRRGAVR